MHFEDQIQLLINNLETPNSSKNPNSAKNLNRLIEMVRVIIISNDDTSLDAYSSDEELNIPFSDSDSESGSYDYLSANSSEDLMNFLAGRDLDWQFSEQTEEGQSRRVSNPKGKVKVNVPTEKKKTEPHYVLRSLGVREEPIVVKKPNNLVKVSNAILALRAPNADVRCSSKKWKS
ncbi:hypothetical protein Tco_0089583 [Tanacetum coccineum]